MRIGMDARFVARGLGIATFITELSEALRRRGDLELVWLGGCSRAPEGVEVSERTCSWPYPLLDLRPGRHLARHLGLDVVHFAANAGWPRQGPAATVLTLHDLMFFERVGNRAPRQQIGHTYLRWVVPRAVTSASALAAVSHTTADEVERRFGRRPTVIPHGIRLRQISRDHADAAPPYLVAFGARDPRKGTELALEVLRRCSPAVSRLEVVARAGLPPGFEDAASQELAAGAVVIHEDLERSRLEHLLAGAAAVLYLSRSEGFGLPVLEAMACGAPVITGLAPATREVGGDAALYVDPADPIGSAVALVRSLSADRAFRAETIGAGRRRAARHQWNQVADDYASLYCGVVARSSRPEP